PPTRLLWVSDSGSTRKARGFYLASQGAHSEQTAQGLVHGHLYYAFGNGQSWDTDFSSGRPGYFITSGGGFWRLAEIEYDFTGTPNFVLLQAREAELRPQPEGNSALKERAMSVLKMLDDQLEDLVKILE